MAADARSASPPGARPNPTPRVGRHATRTTANTATAPPARSSRAHEAVGPVTPNHMEVTRMEATEQAPPVPATVSVHLTETDVAWCITALRRERRLNHDPAARLQLDSVALRMSRAHDALRQVTTC